MLFRSIEHAEPDFAGRVRRLFDAGRHKTIATLRADGSPRISGIECEFTDGELRFGSMTGARKGADLKRDPRFALHGPTFHPEEAPNSIWVPIVMFGLLIAGLLMIVLNYMNVLPGATSNWYLIAGIGCIAGGFVSATQLR